MIEIAPDSLVRLANGVISKSFHLEHVQKRKMACHAKFQILYLQMSMLKVDSAQEWYGGFVIYYRYI